MRNPFRWPPPEPDLPDGAATEPAGWRDWRGRTPVDTVREYVADRHAFELWAASEHRHLSVSERGGQMTDDDVQVSQAIDAAFTRLRQRYLAPEALRSASGGATYGVPPEFDPARLRITAVRAPDPHLIEIEVQHDDPRNPGLPDNLRHHPYRYDLAKVDGEWRLTNRLALRERERPIGGLL